MAQGKWRVYFGRNGVELKDHPLNGMAWTHTGCCLNHDRPSHVHRDSEVIDCPRSQVSGYKLDAYGNEVGDEKTVTVDDFGGEPVLVKIWYPGRNLEYFPLRKAC